MQEKPKKPSRFNFKEHKKETPNDKINHDKFIWKPSDVTFEEPKKK